MNQLGVLAAAFVLSLLAALGAAAQLADHYWYGEDFSLFVVPITVRAGDSVASPRRFPLRTCASEVEI